MEQMVTLKNEIKKFVSEYHAENHEKAKNKIWEVYQLIFIQIKLRIRVN